MAAESKEDELPGEVDNNLEISPNNETLGRNQWVAFEEEFEVPLLPQPPTQSEVMNSEKYIDRLEQKLHRIKNPSNMTSKNMVSALTEARESQMNNMMSDETTGEWHSSSRQPESELNWSEEISEPKCCCIVLCNNLFPKQAKTTQEVECLLDEDELAILHSEFVDDLLNQQAIVT